MHGVNSKGMAVEPMCHLAFVLDDDLYRVAFTCLDGGTWCCAVKRPCLRR